LNNPLRFNDPSGLAENDPHQVSPLIELGQQAQQNSPSSTPPQANPANGTQPVQPDGSLDNLCGPNSPVDSSNMSDLLPVIPSTGNQAEAPRIDIPRKQGVPAPSEPLANVLSCMQNRLNGIPGSTSLVVTATTNDHPPNSPHGRGEAADLRYNDNGNEADTRLRVAAECGARYGLDEGRHPSSHSTAPHYHIQLTPGKRGGRGDLPTIP
jgi:hypothetical protein